MAWSLWIALVLLILGVALLLHHGYVHYFEDPEVSTAQRESCCVACYFQTKDIAHCETWSAICLSNALCFGWLGPALSGAPVDWHMHCFVGVVLGFIGVVLLLQAVDEGLSARHVRNHETWVLVLFTNAVSMTLVFS
jgi:hypothetical protein